MRHQDSPIPTLSEWGLISFGMLLVTAIAVAVSLVLPVLGFVAAGTLTEQFFPPADRDQFPIEVSRKSVGRSTFP